MLVLTANVSLRSAARVMTILHTLFEDTFEIPDWTTGRWWLLRVGFYLLRHSKEQATDWVWMVDHSNQIDRERCLLILGIRLSQLPPVGQCLRLKDMEVIELIPVEKSNKLIVLDQLQTAAEKTGVPRVILHDYGGDLAGGVALFQQDHPRTAVIYDITHKAACLLKARLENEPTWKAFCTQVGQAKFQTQQTELAFLVPPSQRSKARFMNLGVLIKWGLETLAVVEQPPAVVVLWITGERLEQKLGWLREFKKPLGDWSQMQQVIDAVEDFVRCHGHYRNSARDLSRRLKPLALDAPARQLRDELVSFVKHESRKAKKGERLPGSTEVLESSFGRYKEIEGHQSKGGFTGLLLALPALQGELTVETIRAALEFAKTRDVIEWIRDKLGQSYQSKRRMAYSALRKPSQKSARFPADAASRRTVKTGTSERGEM